MGWKPDGYTSLAPYLIVADPEATLAFVAAAFGAERLRMHKRPDGSVMHAEARIDDTVVMIGGMAGSPPANVHVYVPDVDAAYAAGLAAGGTSVAEPETKEDGDRRGAVADPNGIVWWVATQSG